MWDNVCEEIWGDDVCKAMRMNCNICMLLIDTQGSFHQKLTCTLTPPPPS